jgi:hypothetical protein
VVTPQDLHRRHIDQGVSAGPEQPIHFRDGCSFVPVLEGIEDVKRRDQVERRAREGRRGDRRAREPRASGLAAKAQTDGGQVKAVGSAESGEQIDVGAGAAAAIDKARVAPLADRTLQKGGYEGSQAAEPEVTRLGARGGAQQMLHARIVSFASQRLD